MKNGRKPIFIGVSVILVVGVLIGVITGVHHYRSNSRNDDDDEDDDALSSTSKAVASVCSQTDHKKTCVDTLDSVAYNQTASPTDYLQVALNAAIQELKAAMDKSAQLGKSANDSLNKMAVDDCKDLLQYAIDELQASFSMVGHTDSHSITDRETELKNWLSAVISYQQSCIDGFTHQDLKTSIADGLLNATQLTDNALAIVSSISEILTAFNMPVNKTAAASRRLLDTNGGQQVDYYDDDDHHHGFPAWFPSADRKLLASRHISQGQPKPNAVVAQDGTGRYRTIADALAAYPNNLQGRYVIYVKAGIYNEYITVTNKQVNVFMYGDGPRKTIVTGHKCNRDGVSTYQSATFSVIGNGFIGKSMGFQNTAGPQGHQAVALRVQADSAVFYNCRMDGYQDTLYAQAHRQFYRNCVISGTVDFIFGDSSVVLQNCLIIARRPMENQQNTVTAQGRTNSRETTGIVIQNCRIVPEQKLEPDRFKIPTFLGRPWKTYSRTVIMESTLADFIQPAGWLPWAGNFALDTCYYAEYANRGPGANTAKRVNWKGFKVITNSNEALQFTIGPFIQGDQWLKFTGSPYFLGLSN